MLHKRKVFLIQYFSFLAFFASFIMLFNWLVDPYAIFSNNTIPLSQKPAALVQMRMHKAHQINAIQPQTIILGTSRAAVGFDPNHTSFTYHPVYNAGLDGANLYEMVAYFNHANRHTKIKEVILSVDLMSFNANMKNKSDFNENRLANNKNYSYETEVITSLFSMPAITDSLKTVFRKYELTLPTLNTNGLTLEKGLIQYQLSSGGHHNTSLYSERTYANEVYRSLKIHDKNNSSDHFMNFKNLLKKCHKNNIKLTIIISPIHVRHHILLEKLGYWPEYENWKRLLVHYNSNIAKEMKGTPFAIWDFTDLNAYTTEALPDIGNTAYKMRWFWETSHFNQRLGNLILDRIHSHGDQDFSFGVKLTPENIESHLADIRIHKEQYENMNQTIISEVIEVVNNKENA